MVEEPHLDPWWEQWEGRLEYELDQFSRRGWVFEIDAKQRTRGRIVLRGVAPVSADESTQLIVAYPDTFPHTRVAIYAPNLRLKRHQNPFNFNLCAMPRASVYWRPSFSAAHVVETQIPEVVRVARLDSPEQETTEFPQGEPVSTYFGYLPTGAILIPESMFRLPTSARSGTLTIALEPHDAWLTDAFDDVDDPLVGVAAVTRLETREGGTIHDNPWITRGFTGPDWDGRWVHLPEVPLTDDLGELVSLCEAVDPTLGGPNQPTRGDDGRDYDLLGIGFPEEVRQGECETGWFFFVFRRGVPPRPAIRVRASRYSAAHLIERIGPLDALRAKTVSIVGTGALGAPICFQLAASLVGELRPLDHDYFDPATSVRWPAGVPASGVSKTTYLRNELGAQYPLTRVRPFNLHIGDAPVDDEAEESRQLARWAQGASLFIDASAEDNVSRVLAHIAQPVGIPQVFVWSVEGYGGVVARIAPGQTGCYLCLEEALSPESGFIDVPAPPDPAKAQRVQPRGCNDPTFVAPYVDLLPLSIEASRFALSVLSEGGYPSPSYDVLTFEIRDSEGALTGPDWKAWQLPPREGCRLCETASS